MTAGVAMYMLVRMWSSTWARRRWPSALPDSASRRSSRPISVRRFEGRAWLFYVYNIVSSVATVLFAEPKGGVWRFVWELTTGTCIPGRWCRCVIDGGDRADRVVRVESPRGSIRAWRLEPHDRLVIVFAAVLLANAVISFPYTKNVIMSPAGVFLGLAVYAASRAWLQAIAAAARRASRSCCSPC